MAIDFDAIRAKLNKLSGNNRSRNTMWRPTEGEEHTVRLISFPDNEGQPFKELWFYYNIPGQRGLLAPYQFGKKDPVQELITKLRRLRDHGAELSDLQRHLGPKPYLLADHTEAGFNQRMTDIQGALGSAQMDRACEIVTERRRLAAIYDATFADLPWLEIPSVPDGYGHGYQSYPCLFMPEATKAALVASDEAAIKDVNTKRNQWMDDLQNAGISTRPATHAVHMLTFYRDKYDLLPMGFPKAFAANDCSISLPLFHGLSDEEQAKIIEIVRSAPF